MGHGSRGCDTGKWRATPKWQRNVTAELVNDLIIASVAQPVFARESFLTDHVVSELCLGCDAFEVLRKGRCRDHGRGDMDRSKGGGCNVYGNIAATPMRIVAHPRL